ncbi:concanavalin A-like lectin/glucanase [Hyaloscypha variabilis F]|uniref:Concanavalin A-like lectin/glucanase n=1 Tax=Hyaloscypha variabilis (strain UAMH 11265 / GT02V1 / F) TaxID=1149755 RepID=A0A2J6RRC1_HYAVF|nr:concanavalin A-like lectin/glucanase [Hyaloscypha variabilis F]
MKLSVIFSTALFASGILAAPKGQNGIARRQAARNGTSIQRVDRPKSGNDSDTDYSTNWTGVFVVPQPSVPSGDGSGTYSAAIWVGIDGDTYQNAIWQAGIDVTATKSSRKTTYSYDAWYEWYPDYAYDFTGITIGTVVLENETTGQSVTTTISSTYALGGQNAEWIVEDYEENGGQVALADWGTVTFTNTVATGSGGTSEGAEDSDVIELESSSGTILSSVTVSDTEVIVSYV